jgi:DNA-binding transcriptional MerR regulator
MAALTIEELAARTGMSVRNVRAYQAKHLLHGPQRHGRSGLYDESHVERIELIRRLQEEGFNLDAARILIEQGEAFTSEFAQLRENLALQGSDQANWIPFSEEALRIARAHGPDTLNRLVASELLRRDADGQVWVRQEFRIGWRLLELGLPPASLYDLLFAVERVTRPLGRLYADQVDHYLLADEDGTATAGVTHLSAVRGQYEELTTVAAQLLSMAFQVAVQRELTHALENRLRSKRRSGKG